MRKLSLRWRLTLTTALLVTAACLLLNLFVSRSAIMRIDEIEAFIVEIEPAGQDSFVIGLDGTDLSAQIQRARDTFRIQSVLAMLTIILFSSSFTWFLAGRALEPLRELSARMETIQAQNLSEPLAVSGAQDEVARLTRSFNGMLSRLDQAFIAQRQFSANAAHELRTPLAVMQTSLEVLQKREQPTMEEYADAVQMTVEQTGRLSHLVSTLLEMTELQTVQRTDHISLSALIEEVLCDLTQVAEERKITLIQVPGEAELIGSDPLLYRAVYNLVENAIKYNRPGGTVTVGVRAETSTVILSVTDTGTGISREYWESIFEPFVRVDKSRSRAMGGAGLGLALVRDIAVQHGGNARIMHSSDEGTEIVLTLRTERTFDLDKQRG